MSIGPLNLHDPEANPGDYSASMKVLTAQGLSRKEAASLLGQATAESRMGTMYGGKVLGVGSGDSGAASGGFQWHKDRWNPLVMWATAHNINPASWSGQLKMAAEEYKRNWRSKIGAAIEGAKTPYDITKASDVFESYSGWRIGPRGAAVSGTQRALDSAVDAIKKVGPDSGETRKIVAPPDTNELLKKAGQIPVGPMSMEQYQGSTKQASLTIRNVPGANLYATGASLAGGVGLA
jgi:hypothetical protein